MYSTTAYLYQQITKVLLIDTSGVGAVFQRRWSPVYAKKLTINKGVDNVILFEFVNQDQKPVNVTGSTFTFRLINTAGSALIFSKEMTILSAAQGRAKVTLTAEETTAFPAEPSCYSIEKSSGNLTEAVFVDAQAQARGDVDVFDSVFPEFVPSQTCTIPEIYGPQGYPTTVNAGSYPDWARNPGYPYSTQLADTERYTSQVPTTGAGLTTFAITMDHFTGNIKPEAAEDYQSVFFNVGEVHSYYNHTGTVHLNVQGYHPLIRLGINSYSGQGAPTGSSTATATATVANGQIQSITVTWPGGGYLAPPNVSIIGVGAGARAEAEINANGQVSVINVIDGGQGYIPNPVSNIAATIEINTGFITNILYR
jgi:hypothetical protein